MRHFLLLTVASGLLSSSVFQPVLSVDPEERERRKAYEAELEATIKPYLERARAEGVAPREIVAEMRAGGVPIKGIKLFRRTMMKEERAAALSSQTPSSSSTSSSLVSGSAPRPTTIEEAKARKAARRKERLKHSPTPQRSWTVRSTDAAATAVTAAKAVRAIRWDGIPSDMATSPLATRDATPADLRRRGDDGDDGTSPWKRAASRRVAEGGAGSSVWFKHMRKAGGTTVRGLLEAALLEKRERFSAAVTTPTTTTTTTTATSTTSTTSTSTTHPTRRSTTNPHHLVDDGAGFRGGYSEQVPFSLHHMEFDLFPVKCLNSTPEHLYVRRLLNYTVQDRMPAPSFTMTHTACRFHSLLHSTKQTHCWRLRLSAYVLTN